MIEARLKIKYGYNERISLDHILNCSVTNQGCDGGYSYLVSKFGAEMELLPTSCEAQRDYVRKMFNLRMINTTASKDAKMK